MWEIAAKHWIVSSCIRCSFTIVESIILILGRSNTGVMSGKIAKNLTNVGNGTNSMEKVSCHRCK